MSGKKILAVVFAALTLIKLAVLMTSPGNWLGMAQAFMGHATVLTVVYLIILAITGYFVFTGIDLVDIAVVMLFTAALVGLSLIPYAASLQNIAQEIAARGLGQAWLSWSIWAAIAVAVLYRVFARESNNR
jgi:hypothetical protein